MNKSMAVSVSGIVGGFITIIYIIAIISRFQMECNRKRAKNVPVKMQSSLTGTLSRDGIKVMAECLFTRWKNRGRGRNKFQLSFHSGNASDTLGLVVLAPAFHAIHFFERLQLGKQVGCGFAHYAVSLFLREIFTAILPHLDLIRNVPNCTGVNLNMGNDGFRLFLWHINSCFLAVIDAMGGFGGRAADRFGHIVPT